MCYNNEYHKVDDSLYTESHMLKNFCKIMVFTAVAYSFMLFATSNCYAQKVTAMSAKDFVNKNSTDQNIKSIFASDGKQILCGSTDRMCDRETDVCLRCTQRENETFLGITVVGDVKDIGKCVKKSEFDPNNPRASWKGCFSVGGSAKVLGTGVEWSMKLTQEPNGFISKTSVKVIGINLYKNKEEFTDTNGKKYRLFMDAREATVNYGEKGFRGCEILPVKIYNMQSCFFCPISRIIFKAINEVTETAFTSFGSSFLSLMVMIYVIWLAFVTLQQVFAMTKKDTSDYIEIIIKQTFKFMLAYFLLYNGEFLFKIFINPILSTGLRMGEMIQDGDLLQPSKDVDTAEVVISGGYYNAKMTSGETLYAQIESYLSAIQSQMAYMQAIGTSLFCVGTRQLVRGFIAVFTGDMEVLSSGIRMMFLGGILTVCGFLMSLVFAFYFMDAILQLGMLGMMLPLMIAGWPFKATASYASKGLSTLLNTFFVFFFTGFVISVNIILADQSISFSNQVEKQTISTSNETGVGVTVVADQADGLGAIAKSMNEQNIETLRDATNIGGSGFLLLIFASLFGFKFISQVAPLASKLSEGGAMSGGIVGDIGTKGMSMAKGMASKVTKPAMNAVGDKWREKGGIAGIATQALANSRNRRSDRAAARGDTDKAEKLRQKANNAQDATEKIKMWRQSVNSSKDKK